MIKSYFNFNERINDENNNLSGINGSDSSYKGGGSSSKINKRN